MAKEIIVRLKNDGTPDKISQPTTTQTNANAITPTQEAKASENKSQAIALSGMVVQQAMQYSTSNVGKWSGNSYAQTQVNNVQQAIQIGNAFAVNPIVGAINLSMQVGTTAIDEAFRRKQEQLDLANRRASAGYTDTQSIASSRRHK